MAKLTESLKKSIQSAREKAHRLRAGMVEQEKLQQEQQAIVSVMDSNLEEANQLAQLCQEEGDQLLRLLEE